MIVWGGRDSNAVLATGWRYDPLLDTWTSLSTINAPLARTDHTAVLLTNGEVLAVGGYDGDGGNIGYLSSAELFH